MKIGCLSFLKQKEKPENGKNEGMPFQSIT
jgi:hypothetical protein